MISYSSVCDEIVVIPQSSVCEPLDQCLNGSKIPEDLRQQVQDISCMVQLIVEEEDKEEIVSTVNAVAIFGKITPEEMRE